MSDETNQERCPHCSTFIDFCPACQAVKPKDARFCASCYEKWRDEHKSLHEKYQRASDHIDERFNYKAKGVNFHIGLIPQEEEDDEQDS